MLCKFTPPEAECNKRGGGVKIEIADFTFKFKSEQKKVLGILEKRYKKFFIGSKAEFFFEINFLKKPSLPFRPSIIFKEKKLIIKRGDFYCVLDIKNKKGSLEISPKVQSFDSFLRVLCSWLLINKTGFLLHCAGAIMNNKGCLFVGKSGAGKSTIAKCFAGHRSQVTGHEILTDELVPLRIEKGKVKIYGSPFWGEMKNKGENKPGGIELEKIFFLKKAKVNRVNEVSKSEFYKRMLRCVMSFSRQKNDFLKISKTISEIYRKTEVFDLKFSNRDDSFFNII